MHFVRIKLLCIYTVMCTVSHANFASQHFFTIKLLQKHGHQALRVLKSIKHNMLRHALTHIIEEREKHRTGALCVKNVMRKTGKMQETYSEKEKYETNI